MKRLYFLLALITIVLFGESFTSNGHRRPEQFKNDGTITATVDGKAFDFREDNKYTAELKNTAVDKNVFSAEKSDAKLTQVTNALNFHGLNLHDAQGNLYTENIEFHYAFGEGVTGVTVDPKVVLNYEDQQYFNVASETKIEVTKIEWNADRTAFVMSADFDCLMHRWGMPTSPKQAMHLKGKMENINVSVPSWIVTTNPSSQLAQK